MTDPKKIMFDAGKADALNLAARAPKLDGTAIIAEEEKIPAWSEKADYTGKAAGIPVADEDQVWLLLIPHRAADYVGRPATLRALWGLAHTKDPAKAKPWIAPLGISGLYKVNECCTYPYGDGTTHIFRNLFNDNQYPPLTLNVEYYWDDLGEVGSYGR